VIRLGFATDTYDAEGVPTGPAHQVKVTLEEVRDAALRFQGEIEQIPPPFSAKKIAGVRAYKLARNPARRGEVKLEPVRVKVEQFEMHSVEGDRVSFSARVSSGTYLRSIAHDLGAALGVGGHLAQLQRTAVGEFTIAEACTLEDLEAAASAGEAERVLIHPRRLLPDLPCVTVTDSDAAKIRNGRAVNLPELSRARLVKVFRGQSDLIAIASRIAGTLFQPKVVLSGD